MALPIFIPTISGNHGGSGGKYENEAENMGEVVGKNMERGQRGIMIKKSSKEDSSIL